MRACVCKTRILSTKLSVCMCMPALKREDRLVLTYICMCIYIRVS